ncbi:hypothetical protein SAMN05216518_11627 [Bacteroidales bacterium KHT7]|nr:hypothetical protein SAMN05216518_11627 [Bacteroidales bacterium KHT7]
MIQGILAITGKPGLYKLISHGNRMLIVESLTDKKRLPAYGTDKIISLADIAMYTDADEVPLNEVLASVKKHENGAVAAIDPKKASADELRNWFAEILPNFDRDRVYNNDIKKLISWYNILVNAGEDDFSSPEEEKTEENA